MEFPKLLDHNRVIRSGEAWAELLEGQWAGGENNEG
jgi:hypothetical protein